ncbi:hypothetical protein [Chromobacterium vaccinii]|uniref:hypothetical protein n=1 Tax=Chromobacterium vaccinii TaxID=1108595 RepID=UPI00140D5E7A|nr:hypothetical protein [Chromobacterium vaccinii]
MATQIVKQDRVYRILTNALLWICFGGVAIGANALVTNASVTTSVPPEIITHFIDLKLYLVQLGASVLLFALLALITHKANDEAEFNRGRYFIGLVFEEWAAVVINFGSLLFIAGFIAHMPVYWLGTAVNYVLGHYLLPKR